MNAAAPPRWLPPHWQQPHLYAGFWRRVVAWIIDAVILGMILSFIGTLLGPVSGPPWLLMGRFDGYGRVIAHVADARLQSLGILVWSLYYALAESSRWQATPGKLALGLAVTDEVGMRIGVARASGRFFAMFLSALIFCIGFLMAGWTTRKQALHDLVAGCCVVRRDGLRLWERTSAEPVPAHTSQVLPVRGMPAWAIALVVLACVVLAVPVVTVLGVIAVPAYEGYTVRTEVADGLAASTRARSLIAEYIGARGELPNDNRALGLPAPEAIQARFVTSVRVAGGKVVLTYGNRANPRIRGRHVVMSPIGNAAMLHWQCRSPDIRPIFLPRDCRQ